MGQIAGEWNVQGTLSRCDSHVLTHLARPKLGKNGAWNSSPVLKKLQNRSQKAQQHYCGYMTLDQALPWTHPSAKPGFEPKQPCLLVNFLQFSHVFSWGETHVQRSDTRNWDFILVSIPLHKPWPKHGFVGCCHPTVPSLRISNGHIHPCWWVDDHPTIWDQWNTWRSPIWQVYDPRRKMMRRSRSKFRRSLPDKWENIERKHYVMLGMIPYTAIMYDTLWCSRLQFANLKPWLLDESSSPEEGSSREMIHAIGRVRVNLCFLYIDKCVSIVGRGISIVRRWLVYLFSLSLSLSLVNDQCELRNFLGGWSRISYHLGGNHCKST